MLRQPSQQRRLKRIASTDRVNHRHRHRLNRHTARSAVRYRALAAQRQHHQRAAVGQGLGRKVVEDFPG